MAARFEVVQTASERWHTRFRAANGRIVWTTETYERRRAAENAICSLTGHFIYHGPTRSYVGPESRQVTVVYLDEREAA